MLTQYKTDLKHLVTMALHQGYCWGLEKSYFTLQKHDIIWKISLTVFSKT